MNQTHEPTSVDATQGCDCACCRRAKGRGSTSYAEGRMGYVDSTIIPNGYREPTLIDRSSLTLGLWRFARDLTAELTRSLFATSILDSHILSNFAMARAEPVGMRN
jgi:hypothetical protein